MPCQADDRDSDIKSLKKDRDHLTAMLCELCGMFEPSLPKHIARWWKTHQKIDEIRREADKALVEQAIARKRKLIADLENEITDLEAK